MTQRDIAGYLEIDVKTIRNWRKNKPKLYATVMKGLAFDEIIKQSEENLENLKNLKEEFTK